MADNNDVDRFQHCLWPKFTAHVFERIMRGDAFNIVSNRATGKTRLLEDKIKVAQLINGKQRDTILNYPNYQISSRVS
ncbi:MAG: hypothetical protein HQK97_02260 [Nitrospirae bacterium]|nr:hypothetical protein [Nitrospirota bacterium]